MKGKILIILALVVVLALSLVTVVQAATQSELAEVRTATARYHRPEAVQASGYDLVPGLDHCFENPGVGAMGFH